MDDFQFSSQFVSAEREKAKLLRKSRWWQDKLGQAKCFYCNSLLKRHEVTMDHLLPVSKGGQSNKNNVVICCKACNNKKRDLAAFEWENYLASLPCKDAGDTPSSQKK